VSFQPGAPTGQRPSELYLTEIAYASQRSFPSCDWLSRRFKQTLGLLIGTPEIGRREDELFEQTDVVANEGCPSRVDGALSAFGAKAFLPRRPRFRGLIPLPVGAHRRRISPRAGPWLSWAFILPGAFPFRALASTAAAIE